MHDQFIAGLDAAEDDEAEFRHAMMIWCSCPSFRSRLLPAAASTLPISKRNCDDTAATGRSLLPRRAGAAARDGQKGRAPPVFNSFAHVALSSRWPLCRY